MLTELGGRAPLKLLCMKVQEIVVFKGATPYNSICTELINHPKNFRRTEGKKGWWELVSYQEEVAALKKENEELKDSNKRLTSIPKEAESLLKDFWTRLWTCINMIGRRQTQSESLCVL